MHATVYLKPVFTSIVMAFSDVGLNCIVSENYYKLKRFLYKMHILQCNILTKCPLLTKLQSDSSSMGVTFLCYKTYSIFGIRSVNCSWSL